MGDEYVVFDDKELEKIEQNIKALASGNSSVATDLLNYYTQINSATQYTTLNFQEYLEIVDKNVDAVLDLVLGKNYSDDLVVQDILAHQATSLTVLIFNSLRNGVHFNLIVKKLEQNKPIMMTGGSR